MNPTSYTGITLAAVVLLVCNTGRFNSVLSDSHGHGRATDRHFWEQGIPNGTGGISSIFKDHLGTEAIQPSRGGGRRTTSLGQGFYYIGIHIVYTFHIDGNWDVNAKDSYKEFIHARQLVPVGAVYLLLLPQYCLLPGKDIV